MVFLAQTNGKEADTIAGIGEDWSGPVVIANDMDLIPVGSRFIDLACQELPVVP
jgi:hypothetical protein